MLNNLNPPMDKLPYLRFCTDDGTSHEIGCITHVTSTKGAKEDRFHEVAPTAIKATNDPHSLPYPLKEGWWAMAMVKKKKHMYAPPSLRYNVNQGLKQ